MGNFPEGEPFDKDSFALNEELDNAITGTTMSDLKLQKRELQGGADYLPAHREKLMLQHDLEEIRSGKALGDGYVYTLEALRGRLTRH